jgi:putative restriction endonuclease
MKLFVAVTDTEWFNQLSALKPDEVNFWKPSGASFRALSRGEPLLFKLHSPNNFIVGLGYFVSYSVLPASLAWNVFGEKNGAKSLYSLKERIRELREDDAGPDPEIGCRVLTNPEFFPRDQWIPCPASFARNIVQGKGYSTDNAEGDWLWASVEQRIAAVGRYGSSVEVRSRLGQGAFRVLVTDAYHRRCAITGERTLPVLEAAHIMPFGEGPTTTNNGLLLRADLHALYDNGLLTVTPEYKIAVSPSIHEEYGNGREYYALDGKPLLVLPHSAADQPRRDLLDWHTQNVYRP